MSASFGSAVSIGTGQMGPGTASAIALGGVPVTILSRSLESAQRGLETARAGLESLAAHGIISRDQASGAAGRLSASASFDDVLAKADLVVESAPENMAFKQDIFRRMDGIAKPDCILASNTSGLSITAIQSACERPERVVTTHFWNPPHLMPLVEIVKGERTSEDVALKLRDFLRLCGKVPVIVRKDRPGQLGNRLQSALIREALYLVQEGIASVEDIDLAVKNGFGLRLPVYGIFEHIDVVGFDTVTAVADYVSRDLCNHAGAMPVLLDRKERREPFCDWSSQSMEDVKTRRNAFLLDFLQRHNPSSDSNHGA